MLSSWLRVCSHFFAFQAKASKLYYHYGYNQGWYSEHRFNSVLTSVLSSVLSQWFTTPLIQLLNGILNTVLTVETTPTEKIISNKKRCYS